MLDPLRSRIAAILVLAANLALPVAAVEPAPTLALVGGKVIDGYGGEAVQDGVILVAGDRIVAVGRVGEVEVPEGVETISTEGMSVLPGLWDMHVHLMIVGHADYDHWDKTYLSRFRDEIMPAAAAQLLQAGVTSARDLGALLEDAIAVRDRIARGEIPGPTLYVSGPFLQHRSYPGEEAYRWGIEGPADARAKVRKVAEAGVDVVKLIDQDQMTMEEVQAVVDEAHARKLPVIAHAHRPDEIRRGLAAGVDGFEHTGLGTAPEYPADVVDGLRKRANTLFWTPTLTPLRLYEETRDDPERIDDPRWHLGLGADVVQDIRASLENLQRLDYYRVVPRRGPTLRRKFDQLRESGVTLLIGTDSGVPLTFHSDSTWREIDLWVREMGVPAMDAIRAATFWPAVAMGVEKDVGTIAPGKVADVIAVRGDVLRYPALLQDVDVVVKAGRRVR